MFEVVFELIFELLFELVGEIIAALGFHAFDKARSAAAANPIWGSVKYALMGSILGLISYAVLPGYFVTNSALRWGSRIVSPLILGFMLCLVSWFIKRKDVGENLFRFDKFAAGVVFGIAYSATRYLTLG
jgi:hypothetical protein